MLTESDLDLELLVLDSPDEAPSCQHPSHAHRKAAHSDESPVMRVMPLQLHCCGYRGHLELLCKTWIDTNPTLRCPKCDKNGNLFEDCYMVIGRA